jgi:hypothetical protein
LLFYKEARVHCVVLKIRARAFPWVPYGYFGLASLKAPLLIRNRPFRAQQRAWASLARVRGSTPHC